MRISSPRVPLLQFPLFGNGVEDRKCQLAACRNYVGDFFEELTANAFQGTRLKTDSTCDVCPDIQVGEKQFLESKSVGCSGAIIVYNSRFHKDLAFEAEGNRLHYVFWQHDCRIEEGMYLGDLRDMLAKRVRSVTVVSLQHLSNALIGVPLKTLNAKHTARGYGSLGYRDGWQPRLSSVQASAGPCKTLFPSALQSYGRKIIGNFAVYGDVTLGG